MPIVFKPSGFTNVGNTCYMNSVLQALLSSNYLNTYLLKYLESCISHKINIIEYFSPMMREYLRIALEIYNTNNNTYTPTLFKRTLDKNLKAFLGSQQQDGQEFLLAIMNEFIDSSKDKNIGNIINKICGGKYKQMISCTQCYHIEVSRSKFLEITLPIPSDEDINRYAQKNQYGQYGNNYANNNMGIYNSHRINMEHCFIKFGEREMLFGSNKWFCPKCKKKVEAVKKMEIDEVPDLTILTFARFQGNAKNNIPISIYENINLEGRRLGLIATVNHSGSVDGGHYTAKIKRNNNWYVANDSAVYPTTINNVISDSSIYLAFYQAIY